MDKKAEAKNIHAGHRQRMRERAAKNGFDSLEKHEMLEVLLYPVIPQKNTNPIAHELINTFGSFHAVFDAPEEELLKVKGMTRNAAFYLKMMPAVSSYYLQDKTDCESIIINSSEAAYKYFSPKYIGKTVEVAMALLLSNAGKVLACEIISDGTVNAAEIQTRKIIEFCIKHNATQVILCHNHPSGVALPSSDDFITTKNINVALKSINARLVDHIIIANDDYVSMRQTHQFENAFK